MYFQHLPEIVNRFLLPPEPIIIHYTINPTVSPPEKPSAWDVELKLDDSNLKGRMQHVVMSMASDSAKELTKLDEEVRAAPATTSITLGMLTRSARDRRSRCTCSR